MSKTKAKASQVDKNVIVRKQSKDIPEHLRVINCGNMLEACLYPLTKEQFFNSVYQKKALVIRDQPKGRFDQVKKEQMYDLKLAPLI